MQYFNVPLPVFPLKILAGAHAPRQIFKVHETKLNQSQYATVYNIM